MFPACDPNPPSPRPKPAMFIARDIAERRIQNFLSNQHVICNGIIGKNDNTLFHYTTEQLVNLYEMIVASDPIDGLSGLRIYFCDDDQDLLELIFAPTVEVNGAPKDTQHYFQISSSDGSVSALTQAAASPKVAKYQKNKLAVLSQEIKSGDTKSVYFDKEKLGELICEVTYLEAEGTITEGIDIFMSAYDENEPPIGGLQLSKQQSIVINLVKGSGLSEGISSKSAEHASASSPVTDDDDGDGSYDTGIPCPPATICDPPNGPGLP